MFVGDLKAASLIFLILESISSITAETTYYKACSSASGEVGKCVSQHSCHRKFSPNELSASQAVCKSANNEEDYVCCTDLIHLNLLGQALLMEYEDCGPFNGIRIASGKQCHPFNFRWMALLKYDDGQGMFRCAGSLISKRYVLTAAHCVPKDTKDLIAVRLGEYNLSSETDCLPKYHDREPECLGHYEEIGIERYIVHENFSSLIHHDIALLRLARDVEFKKHIKPVCLPINKELFNNHPDNFDIAGWGLMENDVQSNVLLQITAPVQRHAYCEERLALKSYGPLTTGHICVGGENFMDACKGDSGGAMVHFTMKYDNRDTRAVQYGVVSAGAVRCGKTNDPGIYTNLLQYMQWITDHMHE